MATIRNVVIETDVPLVETRGRPASDEYVILLLIKVGESFVSKKSRDTLYQIARNLGIKVSIKSAARGRWRVWKKSERVLRGTRNPLISDEVKEYDPRHGREMDQRSN